MKKCSHCGLLQRTRKTNWKSQRRRRKQQRNRAVGVPCWAGKFASVISSSNFFALLCFSSFRDCNTAVRRLCPPNYHAARKHVQLIESTVNAHSCACCTPVSKREFMVPLCFYATFMQRPDNTWSSVTPASRGSCGIVWCTVCSVPAGPCLPWPLCFPAGPVELDLLRHWTTP